MKMRKITLAVLAATCSISSAHAATIFTDRIAFDAATIGSKSQSFSLATTQYLKYTFNDVTFDTTKAGDRAVLQDGLFQNAVYLATGPGGSVTISSTLNAMGLYIGSADGAQSFAYNANGTAGIVKTLSKISNGGVFIGFADTSPISVTFNTNREFDVISYVTTTNPVVTPPGGPGSGGPGPIAGAVPEPATWAMMLLGFGVVGATMRRRRHNVTVRFA